MFFFRQTRNDDVATFLFRLGFGSVRMDNLLFSQLQNQILQLQKEARTIDEEVKRLQEEAKTRDEGARKRDEMRDEEVKRLLVCPSLILHFFFCFFFLDF